MFISHLSEVDLVCTFPTISWIIIYVVDFEVNVVIVFIDQTQVTENIPIRLTRFWEVDTPGKF